MNKKNLLLLAGLAGTLVAGQALASSTTSNLAVSATVVNNCSVTANNGLSFGSYDPVVANNSTALTRSGTISLKCT